MAIKPCLGRFKLWWSGLVQKLELALFHIDIEQRSRLLFPTSHLNTLRQNTRDRPNLRHGTGLDLESLVGRSAIGMWLRNVVSTQVLAKREPSCHEPSLFSTYLSRRAHSGLPSHPTLMGTYRAVDSDDQLLRLVRSLGFAELHPVNFMRCAHSRLIVSPLVTLAFKLCVVGDTWAKTG